MHQQLPKYTVYAPKKVDYTTAYKPSFSPIQVCNSVFNSWDQFKDHLVIHTGEKPNHCTFCDLWFTQPRDLRAHLRDLHGIQDDSITSTTAASTNASASITNAAGEEVILTEASALAEGAAAATTAATELILTTEDGIRVEHVTVEPMDMVAVEETLVVEAEAVVEEEEEDSHMSTTTTTTTAVTEVVVQAAPTTQASCPSGMLESLKKEEDLEVEVDRLNEEHQQDHHQEVEIQVGVADGEETHVTVTEEHFHSEEQVETVVGVVEDAVIQTVQV